MKEIDTSIEQRLQAAARRLTASRERPSREDIEAYFRLIKELPVPDYADWSERERLNNTERYKAARRQSRLSAGIKDKSDDK